MDPEIKKKLLNKAGALLAKRAHSRGELREKLMKLGTEAEVESALNRLEQLNLLNDPEYAYNFALCRMKQDGWGPAKISESLLRRRIPLSMIESAITRAREELDDDSGLTLYLEQRLGKTGMPAGPKGAQKLFLHLRRRGFDEETISRVLKRMLPSELMQYLDTGD